MEGDGGHDAVPGVDREDESSIQGSIEGVPPEMVWRGEEDEYVEEVYAAGLVAAQGDNDDDIFGILTGYEDASGVSDVSHRRCEEEEEDDAMAALLRGERGEDVEEDFVAKLQESIQRDLPKYVEYIYMVTLCYD